MNHVTDKAPYQIKSLVEREQIQDSWLLERLENLLPQLMDKHQTDMWITIGREYNEDPIALTLFPSAIDSSRRLTIFCFVKNEAGKVKRFVIHSNPAFEPYYTCFHCESDETPLHALLRIIKSFTPNTIAVNSSYHFAYCDGLSYSFFEELHNRIEHMDIELVSSTSLAIDWLQTRIDPELKVYKELGTITKHLTEKALSRSVITPGKTNTKEVVDWLRQEVLNLGIKTSFYPTVDIQRKNAPVERLNDTILPGDIIHLDFGIEYLGLCTDTQQLAYVLLPGESDVPIGIQEGMKKGNDFEDLFFYTCRAGMTGNEIFTEVMLAAKQKEMHAMLYSHPIGYHCHGAGPLVGLYDKQEPIPIRGELPLQNNTCYALEFNVRHYIPEWGHEIPIYLEETVYFSENKMHYLSGRQTKFYILGH